MSLVYLESLIGKLQLFRYNLAFEKLKYQFCDCDSKIIRSTS
jgi:hypothetical protein